jgi:hypothetical protein
VAEGVIPAGGFAAVNQFETTPSGPGSARQIKNKLSQKNGTFPQIRPRRNCVANLDQPGEKRIMRKPCAAWE